MKIIRLNEGIAHLEDLSIKDFLRTIKNLSNFFASEKIDGANLWFGIDNAGKFFTTREQKSRDKDRKYESSDYSMVAAYNGFRSAHDALKQVFDVKKNRSILKAGEMVEIEIIFGKQPNVVEYSADGTNYIVLLRPVNETSDDTFDKLAHALDGKETVVQSKVVTTDDGENILKTVQSFKWKIVTNISKKVSELDISKKEIATEINRLEDFLHKNNEKSSAILGKDFSNFDILTINLVRVPQKDRDEIKLERERLSERVLINFKLPIKRKLFNQLLYGGSFLSKKLGREQTDDLEGFVLTNGETRDQVKIVDRDLFTSINEFNYKIRNTLNGAVMSDDLTGSLESRGGVFGNCKLRIANLFDVKDLAKSVKAKKIFASYKGMSYDETVNNFCKSLKVHDFEQYKTKVDAILTDTERELKEKLDSFKREVSDYKVTLKNGKTVSYSEESKQRTLISFAELKAEIDKLKKHVQKAKSINDLIVAIYGKLIEEIQKGNVAESLKIGGKIMEDFKLIKSIATINEDDAGGDADAGNSDTGVMAAGTTSSAIAPVPFKLFKGKLVKRVKRNYFPNKTKKP